MAGASLASVEWSIHDRWVAAAGIAPASPVLIVVARDGASDARLGKGAWDRAVIARIVTGLARSGASAIGLDLSLDQPSPPGRGGAGSDALLSQSIAQAGDVVLPIALEPAATAPLGPLESSQADSENDRRGHRSWPTIPAAGAGWPGARLVASPLPSIAEHSRGVGHTLAPPEADGISRRAPLFARLGDRAVPALALALAAASGNAGGEGITAGRRRVAVTRSGYPPIAIPVDDRGRVLLGPERRLRTVSVLDVWNAIEGGQAEVLRGLVDGNIAVLLVDPVRPRLRTVDGVASDVIVQARLLGSMLSGSFPREAPAGTGILAGFVLSWLAGWLWLALRWWRALLGVAALTAAYAIGLVLGPALGQVLLPVVLPFAAVGIASALALSRNLVISTGRVRRLEGEVDRIREALVRQESAVEALDEDLGAARAAAARSSLAEDSLRSQLVEARAHEERTRRRLEEVEREWQAMRPVDSQRGALADGEQERRRRECERLGIVTRDPAVLGAFGDLEKAARSALPVLITGEPGTGKELFARAVHRLGPRAERPFVAVNMAAIPPELFESELFGHVRGSFTGAVGERKGYFEQADRGTLFLDEVGELRLEHQSKLLRVLQERSFHRIGATRPTAVDVQLVAASNRDLERGLAEGRFREDLYFRLKGFVFHLPPLRQRRQDIAPLAGRFLELAGVELGRPGLALSAAAMAALEGYGWPGNVRELQHCLRRAAALSSGAVIGLDALRLPAAEPLRDVGDGDEAVLDCLRQHGFDMQGTARALGWDRSTVTQRLKGLGFRAVVEAGGDLRRAAAVLAGTPSLTRTVELKLREYHAHLLRTIRDFPSADAALADCRRRFKNLPERHFRFLELLVQQQFEGRPSPRGG